MNIVQDTPQLLVLESKALFGLLGSSTYVFDKADATLKISGKGFFGAKPVEHPLAAICGVVLQEQAATASERAESAGRTYRIELVRLDGSKLPLTASYSSGKTYKEKLVEKIRQFLVTTPPLPKQAPSLPG